MQQGPGLFSSLKGGAGSLFKNLKDTSSKVMQTVQQSMTRSELDLTYVTSRLVVTSFPAEGIESAYRHHIDDVRVALETRHGTNYSVYNVSGRSYASSKFNARVTDCGWPHRHAPSLRTLYALCKSMYNYLDRDPKNVCVLHCMDGKASSAVVVAALFLYTQLFRSIDEALQMFAVKRCPPGLNASQYRYLHYYRGLLSEPPLYPHHKPVTLATLTLSPVPLFTKNRDGCRPYVEIHLGDQRLLSTLGEYERMRVYHASENKVRFRLLFQTLFVINHGI